MYIASNGSATACGVDMYDSGGPSGLYQNNESFTYTIYPTTPTDKVKALFSFFETETSWDGMYIYDGPSVASPLISSGLPGAFGPVTAPGAWRGFLSGASLPGGLSGVISTHPTGALTFLFVSDGSGTNGGFAANVTCVSGGCSGQPLAGTATGPLSVCANTSFTLSASGVTPNNVLPGISYQWQSAPSCSGPWTNMTGGSATTLSISTSQTATTFYQLVTTCSFSSSNSTNCVEVGMSNCINMTNGSTTTCAANFYDSGGQGAGYVDNENYVYTFNPTAGNAMQITFNSFASESGWDYITIFNGPNTASPILYGPASGTLSIPVLTSTSGPLTIRFTSDVSVTGAGWDAVLSCVPNPNCSGQPLAGTATGPASICTGVSFTLVASGLTPVVGNQGLTYQWQSAPSCSGPWTNMTGGSATSTSITTSQTATTYYQLVSSCAFGSTNVTNCLPVLLNAPTACYCIPSVSSGCTDGDVIATVALNTLYNNSGTGCPGGLSGYSDYTTSTNPAFTTTLQEGYTYSCTVTAGPWSQGYAAWIDYNDDGVFDNLTERIGFTAGTVGAGQTASFPVVLACGAPLGTHRLRVRCIFATSGGSITPCGSASFGETEDYNINFVAGPVTPAIATPVSGPSSATCNTSLAYSVGAGYSGTILWQYSTDNINFIDIVGATSANQALTASGPATFYIRAQFTGIGCTPKEYSNSILTVIVPPVASFTTSSPTTDICRGTAVTITVNSAVAGPYSWNTGATTQAITVSPLNTTSYSVTVGTGLCTANNSISLNVIGGPIAAASLSDVALECPGADKQLLANQMMSPPATGSAYAVTSIPYAPVTSPTGNGPVGDDATISTGIGFPFNFYGNSYTTVNISTNGNIHFGGANADYTADAIPNINVLNNYIAAGWADLNSTSGTNITYGSTTVGALSAFVVSFNNVSFLGGGGAVNAQIFLLSDNSIQIHAGAMTNTNGYFMTMGIENAAGTSGVAAPGRNYSPWSIGTPEAWSFAVPAAPPFTYNGPVTYSWSDGSNVVATTANPIVNPMGPTVYTLTIADNTCSSTSSVMVNTHALPTASFTTDLGSYCENQTINLDGTGTGATLPGTSGTPGTITLNLQATNYLDQSTWTVKNYAGATIASGGPYFGFGIAASATFTPAIADYPISFSMSTVGSFGDNAANYTLTCGLNSAVVLSGSIGFLQTITDIPVASCYTPGNPPAGLTYAWSGPGFTSTVENPVISPALAANAGFYTLVVTDGNGCNATSVNEILIFPNPTVNVTTTQVSCDGGSDGTAIYDVSGGFDYALLFDGVNSGSILSPQTFTGYADGTYSYTVQETNFGCSTDGSFTVTTVPNVPPVIVCPANMVVGNTPGICGAVVFYPAPTATDACGFGSNSNIPAQTNGVASNGTFSIGSTTNIYTVTDASGATSTCSFSVTVNDTQAPYLTAGSICPPSKTACNPVSWTPPNFTDNCPGVQMTVANGITPGIDFPVGPTTVTYTATDVAGNVNTCAFDITVLDTSLAATGITSNRDFNNICLGGDITLTLNGGHLGLVDGTPITSAQWVWYVGGCGTGAPIGSGTSVTLVPTAAGTYNYFVRAEGGCHTTECVSITVVVSAGPPTGSVVYTNVPAYGAPGLDDTLSVNPVAGATFYHWFTNSGHINSVTFNNQNAGPVETAVPTVMVNFILPQQNYQLRVFAGNACGRTNQANTTVRGTVGAPTSMTGPTQACPGSPVVYSIAAIPPVSGNNSVTYNWTLVPASAGTIVPAANGLSATVTFASGFGSAQVCVNGISIFGLAGPAYCTTVTSNAPAPVFTSGNITPCPGGSETYTIAAIPGAVVTWNIVPASAGTITSSTNTSVSIDFSGTPFSGPVSVCANADAGCGINTTCLSLTNGVPGIPGAIDGPVFGVCNGVGINYHLNTSNANSYLWTVSANMSIAGVDTLNAVSVNFLPGFTTGTVTVIAYYNCGQVTETLNVSGTPPMPNVLPSAVCPNSVGSYVITNVQPGTSYVWNAYGDVDDAYCNGPAGACNSYRIEMGAGGGYFTVYAEACGLQSALFTSDPCRVMAPAPMSVEVYPNPTSGLITIDFTSYTGGNYNVTITDLSGRVVMMTDLKASAGRNQHEIDLGFANAGLYMVYVKDANGDVAVTKLAVE